eukprot:356602-Chlamydomonas_euryale.AAC.11
MDDPCRSSWTPRTAMLRPRRRGAAWSPLAKSLAVACMLAVMLVVWRAKSRSAAGSHGLLWTGMHAATLFPKVAVVTVSGLPKAESGTTDPHSTDPATSLLRCSHANKQAYAKMHDYVFFNEAHLPDDPELLLPLYQHMQGHADRYAKLTFLIYLMGQHPDIGWFLWIDAEAAITNMSTSVAERVQTFTSMFSQDTDRSSSPSDLSLIVAQDLSGPDQGRSGMGWGGCKCVFHEG